MLVGAQASLSVRTLVESFGATLEQLPPDEQLPGSYWGESEAGLRGDSIYVRADTPLHSLLHELAHYICMTGARRAGLDRDAGGDDAEECAVCYLQIVLADRIEGFGRDRMLRDMDGWGYTFRLGSARAWFDEDAADACIWLREKGVVEGTTPETFRLRP
ncbi:MAG: hypothetical protein H7Y89_11100 [Steroidobacteraceae bacterium]|nr:hypothetical protein [Steroidobacteraceae bacterium]